VQKNFNSRNLSKKKRSGEGGKKKGPGACQRPGGEACSNVVRPTAKKGAILDRKKRIGGGAISEGVSVISPYECQRKMTMRLGEKVGGGDANSREREEGRKKLKNMDFLMRWNRHKERKLAPSSKKKRGLDVTPERYGARTKKQKNHSRTRLRIFV